MPVEYEVELETDELLEQQQASAIVSYLAEHAPYANYPTEYTSKKPPFQPLYEWVQKKWAGLSASLKTDDEGNKLTKRQTAWKLQTIIFQYGTGGVYFAERSFEHGKNEAPSIAAQYSGTDNPDAPQKAVEDIADLTFAYSQDIVAEEAYNNGTLLQSGQVEVRDGEVVEPEGGGD